LSADGFRAGARAGLPVVLGYLGIGLAAGVVERAAGLSYAEVLLVSTVLYAGSAQFVLASLLSLGNPAPAIVATVFLLNLRHLLLSAALAPALRRLPAWKNALIGLQLTDETFVVASGHAAPSAAWMAGLNLAAWSTWAVANLAGAALSGAIGDTRTLAFALPCMFAGLLVMQAKAAPNRVVVFAVCAAAGAVAAALHFLWPGPQAIVLATILGATTGLLAMQWTSARKS
jgi:predicted branched-subunit amino acid permease